jgi:hypothetical protein
MSSDGFRIAISGLIWTMRLWPVVVVGIATTILRRRLGSAAAFFVLGSLICYGAAQIVEQLFSLRRLDLMVATPSDRLAVVALGSGFSLVLLSLILSAGPVWWLYRLMVNARETRASVI